MFARRSFLALLATAAAPAAATFPTVVDTTHNITYFGLTTVNATVEKFLNIPYGADTSGAARFANPSPAVIPSGSIVNASAQGPVCPQVSEGGFQFSTNVTWFSEDCLRLKVARAAGTKAGDGLPVIVYIYGGGLWNGNINERTNEPDGLVLESVRNGLPVVYVAMNYRLNAFGFALNDELLAEDSLNVGLKDQRLALEWVQENIEYFGGDPNRITIFGQSSGALSVTLQVLAYGDSKPNPVKGALIESTALEPNMTSPLTRDTFSAVATYAGCAVNNSTQSAATIECLRALSMEDMWNATLAVFNELIDSTDGDIWLPAVDGSFIPAAPSELVRDGRFTQMPIVVGWTRNDATLFTPFDIETDADTRDLFGSYYTYLSEANFEELMDLYPVGDFSANMTANLSAEFYRSAEIFRDVLLTCPSFYFGHAMAEKYYNSSSNGTVPVYIYEHNQTILGPILDSEDAGGLGVIHTSELAYVFGNFTPYEATWPPDVVAPTEADYALLRQMSRSWSSFAAVGRPSVEGKDTLQGWEGSYKVGAEMMDAEIYVVGGPEPGMSGLGDGVANEDVGRQKLKERCGFLNREDVIEQLKY